MNYSPLGQKESGITEQFSLAHFHNDMYPKLWYHTEYFPLLEENAKEPDIKLPTSIGSNLELFTDYAKAFDCVDHNKLWRLLQELGIPDHLTFLLRNLYAGQQCHFGFPLGLPWPTPAKAALVQCSLGTYPGLLLLQLQPL